MRELTGVIHDALRSAHDRNLDNDGTLSCEKPQTALAAFLAARSPRAPAELTGHEVLREIGEVFAGMTVADYEQLTREFLASATHPRFRVGYPELAYVPMRELVALLHALEFSVFVCSDSSRDFNRVLAASAYGLQRGDRLTHHSRGRDLCRVAAVLFGSTWLTLPGEGS